MSEESVIATTRSAEWHAWRRAREQRADETAANGAPVPPSTATQDLGEIERIDQLVTSEAFCDDDGTVVVYLSPAEAWSPEAGLVLTEDDALELVDALRQAVGFAAGRSPQVLVHLLIGQPAA